MMRIDSYLRHGSVYVPIEGYLGRVDDEDYVWGAIELTVDGRPIMTRREHDLVADLWAYIARAAAEVLAGTRAHTYFPDQPISFELSPAPRGLIEMRLHYPGVDRSASVDRAELVTELARAGKVFWSNFARIVPSAESESAQQIAELDALANSIV